MRHQTEVYGLGEAYVDQETRVVVFDRAMGRLVQLDDFNGIIGWVRVP